jgi:hypothetical protein
MIPARSNFVNVRWLQSQVRALAAGCYLSSCFTILKALSNPAMDKQASEPPRKQVTDDE